MHDAVTADLKGTPAVGVMTSAFEDGATLMARVLGAPDHAFAVIEHPIASADDPGLELRASIAVARAVEILTGQFAQPA